MFKQSQYWFLNFSDELNASGIENIVRPIPREYASVVTGVTIVTCGVYVEEKDLPRALELLKKHEQALKLFSEPNESLDENHYRKTVMFSLLGVVFIPLLFNIISSTVIKMHRVVIYFKSSINCRTRL